MKLDYELFQRDWQPQIPYRPIGNMVDAVGKRLVFLHSNDFTMAYESPVQKIARVMLGVVSCVGFCMRALASFDKLYFEIEKPNERSGVEVKETLNVLTLNAACLPSWITTRFNDLRPTEERAKEIADSIYKNSDKYDVICLQELFSEAAFTIIHDRLCEKYGYSVHHAGRSYVGFNSGLCIFSKFPIEGADFQRYSGLFGEDAFTNKGFLSADLAVGDKKVRVYTTHAQAGGYPKFFKRHWLIGPAASLHQKQFASFTEHIKKAVCDAVIVTGDFNLNVCSEPEKQIHAREFFSLFKPYQPTLPDKVRGTTYTRQYLRDHRTGKDSAPCADHQTNGRVIDGCFVTRTSRAEARHARVIQDFTNSSDHLAVVTTIALSGFD